MTTNRSRREFLKQTALLLTGLSAAGITEAGLALPSYAKGRYKIGPFTGDDFTLGHKIRDGKPPKLPTKVTEKVDFVIVGGGLAGLASAHYLRDSNFLLLEQYDDLGGHARGGSYNGIGYSYGAAYLSILDGAIGELVNELGLKPITLEDTKDGWYQEGKWLRGTGGGEEFAIFKEFKRLRAEHKDFFGKWNGLYPSLKNFPEFMKLDDVLMSEVLKSYDAGFVSTLDNFLKSALNAGVNSVSALAGLNTIEDLLNPTYLLPGGNPTLTKELNTRLVKSHEDSVKPGAFVWDIKLKEDGAIVTFSSRDGDFHVVECKHVIIAIPHMVTARIARNISDKAKATMFRFRYGAYMVANILCKRRVFDGTYDNFLPAPFEIADITAAEFPYIMNGTYKPEMGQVLTCYIPYEPGSTGRTALYQGNKKRLAGSVTSQLERLMPQLGGGIEEVVLSRWGHAMAVTKPQYFKYVGELQAQEGSSFSFAHSSAHGLPGAEAAAQGAKHAAERARAVKVSAKPKFSTPGTVIRRVLTPLLVSATMTLSAMAQMKAIAAPSDGSKDRLVRTISGGSKNPLVRTSTGGSKNPLLAAAPAGATKDRLVYAVSKKEMYMPVLGAKGFAAVGYINGEQVKGTYLSLVQGLGPGHDCGLVTGDLLLRIDNRVTESPAITQQIVTEYSGIKTTVKYARRKGNVLELKETSAYWTIPSANSSTMPSAGFDATQSFGAVTHAKHEDTKTEDLENFMIEIVNNDRTMNGDAPKLRKSDSLTEMARAYADDMVKRKFFSHKDPDGKDMFARGTTFGITGSLAENISTVKSKTVQPRELVRRCQSMMMNEPANVPDNHRGNILNKEHKCIGVGIALLPEGGVIAVQEFSADELP